MQETWVQSLVQEDSTCHETTKPMYHNCWACALEPGSHNCQSPWALQPVLHQQEKPPQWVACPLQLDSSPHSSQLAKVWAATMRWIQCKLWIHEYNVNYARETRGWGESSRDGPALHSHELGIPGGPLVTTLCFHCRGPGFDPWLGN